MSDFREPARPDPLLVAFLLLVLALIAAWWQRQHARGAPGASADPAVLRLSEFDAISEHAGYSGWLFCAETGAGKSTTAEHVARYYLRRGAGFCWLMAKPDEWQRLQRLATEEGRAADLVRVAPGEPAARCNFLQHLLSRPGGIEAAASVLEILVEVSARQQGKGDEMFWQLACARYLRNSVAAVWLAFGKVSMDDVYRFLTTAPSSREQMQTPEWAGSFAAQTLVALARQADSRDVDICARYWAQEVPNLSERTLSTISTMALNIVSKFVTGPLAELICCESSSITPDDIIHRHKIVGIDTPLLTYDEPGRFLAIVWTVLTQKAALARPIDATTLPTVLWRDEYQLYAVADLDMRAQTVSRSQKLVSCILFQSLPVLYAALGGTEKARHEAHGLIACHVNKLLGAQSCPETCAFFSKMLGESRQLLLNTQSQHGRPYDWVGDVLGLNEPQTSAGCSEHYRFDFPPEAWATLARGGPRFHGRVEMICHTGGERFSNGNCWIRAAFKQRF